MKPAAAAETLGEAECGSEKPKRAATTRPATGGTLELEETLRSGVGAPFGVASQSSLVRLESRHRIGRSSSLRAGGRPSWSERERERGLRWKNRHK